MKKPLPKSFDASVYSEIIQSLDKNMSELEFEKLSEVVVPDILQNLEGFHGVEKGPDFRGTPFDFFGYKNGKPYIIEFKGSLKSFNTPGETQKKRLQKILKEFANLHVVLLQVKLSNAQYRIFYDDEMRILFEGKEAPLYPIFNWLSERFNKA